MAQTQVAKARTLKSISVKTALPVKKSIAAPQVAITPKEKSKQISESRWKRQQLEELIVGGNIISFFGYEQLKNKVAVCRITNKNPTGPGSINDKAMGIIEGNDICGTCHLNNTDCPGHLGYLDMEHCMIYHPFVLKEVIQVLNCVCHSCGGLLLSRDEIHNKGIDRYSQKERLDKMEEASIGKECRRKNDLEGGPVTECRKNPILLQQKIKETYQVHYTTSKTKQPKSKEGVPKAAAEEIARQKEEETKNVIPIRQVLDIFLSISNVRPKEGGKELPSDAELLGFTPSFGSGRHTVQGSVPANMIIRALPIIPPITRYPTVIDGEFRDHPLTRQYLSIISDVLKYKDLLTDPRNESKRAMLDKDIFDKVRELFESSDTTNNRQIKGLKDLIQGKTAVIRNLLMGKRGNYTARTVIGIDPYLKFGQIRIPKEFAKDLTRDEVVCQYNIKALQDLVDEKPVIYGDQRRYALAAATREDIPKTSYRMARGASHIVFGPARGNQVGTMFELKPGVKYTLLPGDTVKRHLRNGDYITFGRQPTLHKQSLMAFEVVLGDELSIGLHESYTTPFNADRIYAIVL